jgi:hypothetical protein
MCPEMSAGEKFFAKRTQLVIVTITRTVDEQAALAVT